MDRSYPLFLFYFLWREPAISELFINEQIRDKEIRLIGESGEQLGIMSSREALKLAEEAGLDLVKIAPTAKPPVCKIVDYGKYRYELARKEKDAKRKQKVIEVKEIRMSPNIDTNDLNTKVGAARKFLEKGNRVKVTLRFRGREMAHMSTSKHCTDAFRHRCCREGAEGGRQKHDHVFNCKTLIARLQLKYTFRKMK